MKFLKKKFFQLCIGLLFSFAIFYFHLQMKSMTFTTEKLVEQNLTFDNFSYHYRKSVRLMYGCNVCLYSKPKVIFLVTSHVRNVKTRKIIRQSYPKDLFAKFNAQMVFLLAIDKNIENGWRQTENEFREHNDIVQGDFEEEYRNLTLKHLMGFEWVHNYCSSVVNVVKMDDDIVLNYYKLFEIVNYFKFKFDLLGHVIEHMKPIRNIRNKWYVSEVEFKNDEYPPFLSGWVYVATIKAITSILQASEKTPCFWIDDVFVTGILRKNAGLRLFDIKNYFRYEPKNLECCILNKYTCDFLAAPNGKNDELHLKFSNHLWECRYKKQCFIETNFRTSCWSTNGTFSLKGQLIPMVQKIEV